MERIPTSQPNGISKTERARQQEAALTLNEQPARPVGYAGLESCVCSLAEAPRFAEVVGGLRRIADPELEVIDAEDRKDVAGAVRVVVAHVVHLTHDGVYTVAPEPVAL